MKTFIRLEAVMKATGLARSTVYKYMDQGRFTQSVPIGIRCVGWVKSEVEAWIEQRIQLRDEYEEIKKVEFNRSLYPPGIDCLIYDL